MILSARFAALALLYLTAFPCAQAEGADKPVEKPAAEAPATAFKEVGFTLGTPAVGNIVLGYWNDDSCPWLIRFAGMDYGKIRGFQGDIGWAFSKASKFKQYVAAAFATSHLDENSETYRFTGAGPVYGFNWYGISLEAGIMIGSYSTDYGPGNTVDGSPVQLAFQIGYTKVW